MSSIVKLGVGQFLKCHGMKECVTKKVKDEKHFLLDCLAYMQISSQFQNICHTTNFPNLLTQHNYGDLGQLLLMLFDHKNKILKNCK
jgi:hypothetical protein